MKVLLNVTVGEIPDKINRQIEVDENISLSDLCEYIIISMNGNKILLYGFMDDDIIYSPILDLSLLPNKISIPKSSYLLLSFCTEQPTTTLILSGYFFCIRRINFKHF